MPSSQSSFNPAFFGPADSQVYSIVGDVYRFAATGETTGGAFTLIDALIPPGGGPPPHIHTREDEAFYVLEGEMTFLLGDRKVVGGPGSFVLGPRGVPHGFRNEGRDPARMLVQITPAGIENFLKAIGEPLPSFDSPALPVSDGAIQKIVATAPDYGIELLPPPA